MRPERRGPGRPFRGLPDPATRSPLPFEPIDDAAVAAVAQVENALADAGRRARADASQAERPDPGFAAALRERLLIQLPARAAADPRRVAPRFDAHTPGTRSPRTMIIPSAAASDQDGGVVGFVPTAPMPDAGRPQPVVGRLAWTGPRLVTAPRWAAALVAAVLVVAAIGLGPGRTLLSGPAPSHATDVVGATLLRGGTATALAEGTELRPGDEIRTAADGRATLVVGGGFARLDSEADVVVQTLDAGRIVLDQEAGRVYHRVSVWSGGSYAVTTIGVTWTAHGTAFDLDRRAVSSGETDLTLLAVQHDVVVDGPGISVTIAEGRRAEIVLNGAANAPDVSTGAPSAAQLHDPWLAANARLDAAAGFDPGVLVALLATEPPTTSIPTPKPEPSQAEPTTEPSVDPGASSEPGSEPSTPTLAPADTPRPTPKVTPKPTPKPKPIAELGLSAKACPGGTVLAWGAAPADGFHQYKTFWSGSAAFSGPSIVDGSATTNRSATSTVDAGVSGARWYRTYAYDAAGHVVAASPIQEATGLGGPSDLGALSVGPAGADTSYSWPEMSILAGCYSATKLVYSTDGEPGYGQPGTTLLWWSGDSTVHALAGQPTPSGTRWFRIQVLIETALRTVATAQTAPVQYTVP